LYVSKQDPQVFASGYSPQLDLLVAIQEATEIALQALPKPEGKDVAIDLAVVTVSSLYDGQSQPSIVVPAVLQSAAVYGKGIQNLVGCTTGGIVASVANIDNVSSDKEVQPKACSTIESEGVPGVSVTLCLLPDVNVKVRYIFFVAAASRKKFLNPLL
jgi:small ligand-binding sensory domain FIST